MKILRFIRQIVFCREDAGASARRLHQAYLLLTLFCFSLVSGISALLLTADSYSAVIPRTVFFSSYLDHPSILVLNLLPPVLSVVFFYVLTRRAWLVCLFSVIPTVVCATVNYYKIQLRGDPFIASDLRLLRTAGGIVGRYNPVITRLVLSVLILSLVMLLFSIFLLPNGIHNKKIRLITILICLMITPVLYARGYLSEASYEATRNEAHINKQSDTEQFLSRGFWYSFLRSIPDAISSPPAGYSEKQAKLTLSRYEDAVIPPEKRVNVVGVMLEAFCDLTDFPMLAEQETVAAIYEPLHKLEAQSVSGDLITNIFAGGTVDTEWAFLTGYSHHGAFHTDLDTYVRYFKAQGYDTVYRHPGYSWFYNRRNINQYFGFDESMFSEDGFGDLVDPELAPYRSDRELFDYLYSELSQRTPTDAPLFSFSVTYQNHGPYDDVTFDGASVTPANSGWSEESCAILSRYLYGIENTIEEINRFVDHLNSLDTPVVLVLFGDHKPWLGNDKSVYLELGVNMELDTEEGFRNTFSTPYLIWANPTAKRTLGRSFLGYGGDISPCFLMEELFDCCVWEGPGFLQLAREVRALLPLVHDRGRFLVNDSFLTKAELPENLLNFYLNYRYAEYWRETKGLNP